MEDLRLFLEALYGSQPTGSSGLVASILVTHDHQR